MYDGALAVLDSEVGALLNADLSSGSGVELMELLTAAERLRRRWEAVGNRLVAEIESRRLAGEYARSTTADLLVNTLRIAPGEARARVTQADHLRPRSTLTGEPLPPLLPAASAAVAAGEISGAHVAVITHCIEHIPSTLSPGAVEAVESVLVQAARFEHPGQLRRTAALLLARLDPDGPLPGDDVLERSRQVTLTRHLDGSGRLRGRLTPDGVAVWDTILDALSAPASSCEDGEPDPRSAGQRRHDGLLEAGHRLLRSGSLPPAGGVPVTILIRTTAVDLANPNGVCLTSRGDLLSTRDVLAMAGEADLVPVTITESGAVLALGRTTRLATRAQRLALTARDGGCCFPGCDRPAAWTQVHHVREWTAEHGPTDIDNLCLLCRYHHREFERRGWAVQMTDGIPEWTPPPFIDPLQRPRRNRAHHPPDIDFSAAYRSAAGRASPAA